MIRESVSAILKFENKYFFIKRHNHLRAFPGYLAFPGGKIDKIEKEESLFTSKFQKYSKIAAAIFRELEEELGVNFSDHPSVKRSEIIGHAVSPEFNPVRFKNYYIYIELDALMDFSLCPKEIADSLWLTRDAFYELFNSGHSLCVKPMFTVLDFLEIGNFSVYQDFRAGIEPKIPSIEMISGVKQYMPLSNTILPATRTNCFYIGDYIIDPSPKDYQEYIYLKSEISKLKLEGIIISHHHPDHHQFSNNLARDLDLPVYISKDSEQRILKKKKDYFDNIERHYLFDEMIITTWKNKNVKCYAIPGHDEGHFGFAPDCMSWFIVGDLFQGVGTVVVGGDEGDMDKYINSLQRVIDMKPSAVIPSHGIALGGTNILQRTLKHRFMREEQIIELLKNGKAKEDLVNIIYFDLDKGLIKYAQANIDSHLKRIERLKLI